MTYNKINTVTTFFNTFTFIAILIIQLHGCFGTTISCFTCASRNGSLTSCEDPFNATSTSYTERCKVPRRSRDGLFPAHFCIKLIGTSYTTKEKLTIRWCSLENMDSQCGDFRLSKEFYRGCILTCDRDGCNSCPQKNKITLKLFISSLIMSMFLKFLNISTIKTIE